MENETYENDTNVNFGKEIAQSFVISAAVTAGMIAGLGAVGLAIQKFEKIKEARKTKKIQNKED